jgi:hypothetical protein
MAKQSLKNFKVKMFFDGSIVNIVNYFHGAK